jgi:hypothetical protein
MPHHIRTHTRPVRRGPLRRLLSVLIPRSRRADPGTLTPLGRPLIAEEPCDPCPIQPDPTSPARPTSPSAPPRANCSKAPTPSALVNARHGIGDPLPAERIARHALEALAGRPGARRVRNRSRWITAVDALAHGAQLEHVATAMGLDVDEAAVGLRMWADGQHSTRACPPLPVTRSTRCSARWPGERGQRRRHVTAARWGTAASPAARSAAI